MTQQLPMDNSALAERYAADGAQVVLPDVAYRKLLIVNVVFIGDEYQWVLVDTGVAGSAPFIKSAAEALFGPGSRPAAIVLTHGHFDHVGALETLLQSWNVPVFAHPDEHPYLNGTAKYPPPDPSVGGGLMSLLAPLYPRGPVNIGSSLKALPSDGSLPYLPGWQWKATPGHSPGHISLWREQDRTLIAGDAVITTRQESAYAVLTQEPELHGPPTYFTTDWPAARRSLQLIASLAPERLLSGHGPPLEGTPLRDGLELLARKFDEMAVPEHGRYVSRDP